MYIDVIKYRRHDIDIMHVDIMNIDVVILSRN